MGRIVKTPIALSLVMTMSAAVLHAVPGVAAAAPPAPTVAASPPGLEWLKRMLLTESEMPAGYAFDVLVLAVDGGAPEPAEPCAGTPPDGAMQAAPERYGPMASIVFQKGKDGPTVSEAITATGSKAAGKAVERYQDILERCPVVGDKEFQMSYARWPLPKYGDASIGYVLTMGGVTPAESPLRLRSAMVARGDLLIVFTKMDSKQEDGADLKKAVQAGMKKLGG